MHLRSTTTSSTCSCSWPRSSCCVCVKLQLWTAQPPLAEWIRRRQPAHTHLNDRQVQTGKEGTKAGKGQDMYSCTTNSDQQDNCLQSNRPLGGLFTYSYVRKAAHFYPDAPT
eukprot:364943-Chlamydomonas_euryale.AAC.10